MSVIYISAIITIISIAIGLPLFINFRNKKGFTRAISIVLLVVGIFGLLMIFGQIFIIGGGVTEVT